MSASAPSCFQCGLPAPDPIHAVMTGEDRAFCCHGCRSVAELIGGSGLESYYERREGFGRRPRATEYPFEDPGFVEGISRAAGAYREATLELEGLHCAACVWLIERLLGRQPGVIAAHVNLTARRLALTWDPALNDLARLAALLASLGYSALPYDPSGQDQKARQRLRDLLLRVGIAGLGAAGAMYLGDPLNRGGFAPHEQPVRLMLTWGEFLITTPAALVAGWPFFRGAWTGLRAGMLTMDATITLAALVAFAASAWAALTGRGAVYFDCVMMLLFALLVGRTLEAMARRKVFTQAERHWRLEAPHARLVEGDIERRVATSSIRAGDRLRVLPGEKIPVDGRILVGESSLDESLLTGEASPVRRGPGERLTAGTMAVDGSLLLVAERVGEATTLAQIVRWVHEADASRAPSQRLADRAASFFLPGLILASALTFLFNRHLGFDPALQRSIAVLIVTCPCALGLATPAAIAVAMARGARDGLLFKGGDELEALGQLTHLACDKTGTLTCGRMRVAHCHLIPGADAHEVLGQALALESLSEHPLAQAIALHAREQIAPILRAEGFRAVAGLGVSGTVEGRAIALGCPAFLQTRIPPELPLPAPEATAAYLACEGRIVALFEILDSLRPDAIATLAELRAQGVQLSLISGDRAERVQQLAGELGLSQATSGMRPETKREAIRALAGPGRTVAMLGDGLNDAPALAAARVGIAMGHGPALAASAAGLVLLGDRLGQLLEAIALSRRTRRLIRSNFALSGLYNLAVIPLAAVGAIPPQWAAWLMPLSSLLVLGNSLRLMR